ncbi:MAG: homoserine O-acetyltransferase [Rhodothermales bacterium]|nr:homoserine O-acetyltransferase [Rhodothermales bacterium]
MLQTLILPEFTLESGQTLRQVPVAYQTWGTLNEARDNAIVVCHALTGNTAIDDWWGGLLGPGKALDPHCSFIVAANVPGSPYGSVSPLTRDPETGRLYGPDFPIFSIRDSVQLHRRLLDVLGVARVSLVIGGSMGGMQVLEWAFFGDYVRAIVPIAVGGRHSAWCIGWSEMQRQAIYADPKWRSGAYDPEDGPVAGLSVARMAAMISYRSRASFEDRFGRSRRRHESGHEPFAIASYLQYQGEKLTQRFDANCYVRLTQLMDTHDIARGRGAYPETLALITQPTLILGITSDILYPLTEQEELQAHLPDAELSVLETGDGHDAFLIEVDTINDRVYAWMRDREICRERPEAPRLVLHR